MKVVCLLPEFEAHLQWCAHDDQQVCQWEVCDILEEVSWKLLTKKHDVRLYHALTGGTLGDRPTHHVGLTKHKMSNYCLQVIFFFPTKCFKLIRVWHKYTRFQWKYNLKNPLKKERNNCLFANSLNELWEFKSSPVQVWGKNIFLVDSRCLFFLLDRKNTNAFDSSETCSPNKQNPCYRGTEESINPHSWREVWVLQQRRLWTSERNKHYTYPNHVLNSCSTSQSGHWFIILPT